MVALTGAGFEPLAMLSLAAINCRAKITLASDLLGVPSSVSNSACV